MPKIMLKKPKLKTRFKWWWDRRFGKDPNVSWLNEYLWLYSPISTPKKDDPRYVEGLESCLNWWEDYAASEIEGALNPIIISIYKRPRIFRTKNERWLLHNFWTLIDSRDK